MKINEELIQYCKNNDFPINDMNINDFKRVEKSAEYNSYLLNKYIYELFNSILEWMINLVDKVRSNQNSYFKRLNK